jgi:hypothetical protein
VTATDRQKDNRGLVGAKQPQRKLDSPSNLFSWFCSGTIKARGAGIAPRRAYFRFLRCLGFCLLGFSRLQMVAIPAAMLIILSATSSFFSTASPPFLILLYYSLQAISTIFFASTNNFLREE